MKVFCVRLYGSKMLVRKNNCAGKIDKIHPLHCPNWDLSWPQLRRRAAPTVRHTLKSRVQDAVSNRKRGKASGVHVPRDSQWADRERGPPGDGHCDID